MATKGIPSPLAESVTLPFTLVVCAVIGNANRSARKTVRITYMSILLLTTKDTLNNPYNLRNLYNPCDNRKF